MSARTLLYASDDPIDMYILKNLLVQLKTSCVHRGVPCRQETRAHEKNAQWILENTVFKHGEKNSSLQKILLVMLETIFTLLAHQPTRAIHKGPKPKVYWFRQFEREIDNLTLSFSPIIIKLD